MGRLNAAFLALAIDMARFVPLLRTGFVLHMCNHLFAIS
jgi:hypothetical protein